MKTSNKKSVKFYFISAFLWLGVAFSVYFIFDVNKRKLENTEQNIIKSAEKLENFHQNLFAIDEKWWERREMENITEMYSYKNSRDMEVFEFLKNSNDIIDFYSKKEQVIFSDIEKHFYKTENKHLKYLFTEDTIKQLISFEEFYIKDDFTRTLYKNRLLQTFREDKNNPKKGLYQRCGLYNILPFEFTKIEKNKIGIRVEVGQYVFKDVTYKNYPLINPKIFRKDFEFETSTKKLGRNPKTITKKYRTLPKEGQDLKAFDYKEIE